MEESSGDDMGTVVLYKASFARTTHSSYILATHFQTTNATLSAWLSSLAAALTLLDALAELAQESGKHMSKKDKKRQRSTFREYMSTLVDDESPCETVIFRGGTLELTTWKEIKQLGAVRACCQGAFMLQMSYNTTLHDIFGADMKILNNNDGMSSHEKRMLMSKVSNMGFFGARQRPPHLIHSVIALSPPLYRALRRPRRGIEKC